MASLEELQEELVRQSSRRLDAEHERVRLDEQWRAAVREGTALRADNARLRDENAALAARVSAMEDELTDLSTSLLDEANLQVAEANRRAAAAHRLVEERDDLLTFQNAELQALKEMLERVEEEKQRSLQAAGARKIARVASYGQDSPSTRLASSRPGTPQLSSIGAGSTNSGTAGADSIGGSSTTNRGEHRANEQGAAPLGLGVQGSGPAAAEGAAAGTPPVTPQLLATPAAFGNLSPAASERVKALTMPGELTRDLVLDLDAYSSPLRPIIRTDLREFKEFVALWGVERDVHPTMFAKLEAPPWRRTKFVQRVIAEDIEPTLRLDRTPHMSWLSVRAYLSGILEQTLALEPVSARERPWAQRPSHPCLLCGENRGDDIYARIFWTKPTPEADPIVLDLTCVIKTRLVCELVAFLRTIAARPPTDADSYARAWRQCNAMREQLFWARTGGLFPEAAEALAAVQPSGSDDFNFNFEELKQSSRLMRNANTQPAAADAVASTSRAAEPLEDAAHTSATLAGGRPQNDVSSSTALDAAAADTPKTAAKSGNNLNADPSTSQSSDPQGGRATAGIEPGEEASSSSKDANAAQKDASSSSNNDSSGDERFTTPTLENLTVSPSRVPPAASLEASSKASLETSPTLVSPKSSPKLSPKASSAKASSPKKPSTTLHKPSFRASSKAPPSASEAEEEEAPTSPKTPSTRAAAASGTLSPSIPGGWPARN